MPEKTYFEMKHPVHVYCPVWSGPQQKALGELLAGAVMEGRAFEVQEAPRRCVLVLLAPADDLGQAYRIAPSGTVTHVGVTEKV